MGQSRSREAGCQPWLESRLRRVNEEVIKEPVPPDMIELLRRLDASDDADDDSGS
jgi:hypothetical protein